MKIVVFWVGLIGSNVEGRLTVYHAEGLTGEAFKEAGR